MDKTANISKRTILLYSRISIWLALLFISGGMAMQSVQVNLFSQADVDHAFASAMAEQMSHNLSSKLNDTRRQQLAASQHPNTLDALRTPNPEWLDSLKAFMPGAIHIQLLSRNQAIQLQSNLGFAVQDLVSRTLRGADMRLEAVARDNQVQFYWASPVRDEQQRIVGILLVEYGKMWLERFQPSAAHNLGQVWVHQYVDGDISTGLEIFRLGRGGERMGSNITVPINDYWFLTYRPADERPRLALAPFVTPWVIVLIATLLGLFLMLALQKRELQRNHLKLLTYVRSLARTGNDQPPTFTLALFDELAQQMRHLIRTAHPNEASATEPTRQRPDLDVDHTSKIHKPSVVTPTVARTNPDLPHMDVEELPNEHPPTISRDIFRAYDIRGIVGEDLDTDVCYWIGRSLGAELRSRDRNRIHLAWDGRHSSPDLANALQQGLLDAGCHVTSLGAQPTGLLYYATHELEGGCGVVVTGSHNPSQYNGLKIVIDQLTLAQDELTALYHRIARNDLPKGEGALLEQRDLLPHYLQRIEDDIQIHRDLTVVVDAGNGIAGPAAKALMARLNIRTIDLFCDVDGDFPNHHPDPNRPENLIALQSAVAEHNADVGIAFDGDGDRVALVDNKGKIIWADRLLMLLIEDILPRNVGRDVLFDVKSSRHLSGLISRCGGRPTMWKTGHSLMKKKMRELNAIVGGEFSGHFYIQDRWYGFDDGLYAAARLLELISAQTLPCDQLFAQLPEDISTPEITLDTTDQRKFVIVDAMATDADLGNNARVFTTDGIRIEFADGWGLIRASNTTAKLTLRFAGNDQDAITRIQRRMKQALTRHAPEIQVPFG